jgi:hypothetical protein
MLSKDRYAQNAPKSIDRGALCLLETVELSHGKEKLNGGQMTEGRRNG